MRDHEQLRVDAAIQDPIGYDLAAMTFLVKVAHAPIERAITILRDARLAFPSMQRLHDDALDMELLYRQCIPAASLAMRLGLPVDEVAEVITLFARCQTLILNHMDRHLDLSSSYSIRDPALLLRDSRAVMCHSTVSLYDGILMASRTPAGMAALREMSLISLNIVQSMYDNYATRFSASDIQNPALVLQAYDDPVRSRHLGSGFYSSSIMGLYAYFDLPKPPNLTGILRDMRRLRQRVDELADIYEDTVTGLINYPVARLLASPEHGKEAGQIVQSAWDRARVLIRSTGDDAGLANDHLLRDRALNDALSALMKLLVISGAMSVCYDEAIRLWSDVRQRIEETFEPCQAEILRIVVDLKRALLERLATARWENARPSHTFNDIRAAAIGKGHDGQEAY